MPSIKTEQAVSNKEEVHTNISQSLQELDECFISIKMGSLKVGDNYTKAHTKSNEKKASTVESAFMVDLSDIISQNGSSLNSIIAEKKCNTFNRCLKITEYFSHHFNVSLRHHSDLSVDKYMKEGEYKLARKIHSYVCNSHPIQMILPAFPCKSPNNRTKVLGTMPDRTEELALLKLDSFCEEVKLYYPYGCYLTILSDGRVFSDLIDVPDNLVSAYDEFLKSTLFHDRKGLQHINFQSLDDHLSSEKIDISTATHDKEDQSIHDMRRDWLMETFENEVKSGAVANELVQLGFTRYLMEDRIWPSDIMLDLSFLFGFHLVYLDPRLGIQYH
ncbi:Pyoverdine/dityrosine biosynthesis protein-domain-containing protein [Spinellus fusiger]|nr:Pyoverdine/dityrosine biosynthesis protein-domain-containing protein [Spinellus fusiger]